MLNKLKTLLMENKEQIAFAFATVVKTNYPV